MDAPLILASASPRRCTLLARAGYHFEVLTASVTERASWDLSLRELTTANATRKALAVARTRANATVLAADTLVALEGKVIGKPATLSEACNILRQLSGRIHQVCTSVFLTVPSSAQARFSLPAPAFVSFSEISSVQVRTLTDSAIDTYLKKVNPLDKAGAYAAQGAGSDIIASIAGSITNVMGLPMKQTIAVLRQFGIHPAITVLPPPLRLGRQ